MAATSTKTTTMVVVSTLSVLLMISSSPELVAGFSSAARRGSIRHTGSARDQSVLPRTRRSHEFLNTRGSAQQPPSSSGRSLQMAATPATPAERQAVADFKMITEEESQLRKTGGLVLGLITAVVFVVQLFAPEGGNYPQLCAGVFGALSLYRTGADYQ